MGFASARQKQSNYLTLLQFKLVMFFVKTERHSQYRVFCCCLYSGDNQLLLTLHFFIKNKVLL